MNFSLKILSFFFLCSGLIYVSFGVFPEGVVFAQISSQDEARLRAEQAQLEAEVVNLSKDVTNLKGQKATIQQAIALIDAQIKEAQAKIRLRTLSIEGLTKDIGIKATSIGQLEGKLERGQDSLAVLIRRTNENDDKTLPEILFSSGAMSEFFVSVDTVQSIKGSLNLMVEDVRNFKEQTQEEKADLEIKKAKETDTRKAIEAEKRIIESKKAEQAELLKIKNGQLTTYEQWVSQRKVRIAQIQSALFELRGSEGIPFGDAYNFAVEASKVTGVRPAFILGILRQESNLGKNVGQCLLVDPNTGAGKGKNTGTPFSKVMHPTRDVADFITIVNKLRRDPYNTPISCPQSIGYGGAMGPSQFIASTWKGYASKLATALNVSVADPWIPQHAIMATALFLKDLGAAKGGYSAEQEAAARYYAGGNWKSLGLGYASSVLTHATTYQEQINFISGN